MNKILKLILKNAMKEKKDCGNEVLLVIAYFSHSELLKFLWNNHIT